MNTTPRHSSPLQTVMIIDSTDPEGLREKRRSSSWLVLGLGGGDGGVPRSADMAAAAAAIPPPAASSSDGLGLGIVVAVCFVARQGDATPCPLFKCHPSSQPPPKDTFPTCSHTFSNCPRSYEEEWQWWCSAALWLATPHLSTLPSHIPSPVGEHRGSCVGVAALRHGVAPAEDVGGDDDVAASSAHREAGITSGIALAGRPAPDTSEGEGMATSKSVIDRLSTRNQMSPFHTCPPHRPHLSLTMSP